MFRVRQVSLVTPDHRPVRKGTSAEKGLVQLQPSSSQLRGCASPMTQQLSLSLSGAPASLTHSLFYFGYSSISGHRATKTLQHGFSASPLHKVTQVDKVSPLI